MRFIGADSVEMRREQDGLADFVSWPQTRDEIGAARQNLLKFDLESGMRGNGRQKIRCVLFSKFCQAGLSRRSPALRGEGGIHAGQRNEFGQQFFRARHTLSA